MADTDNKAQAETTKSEEKKIDTKPAGSKLMPIIMIAVVVIVCLGGGFMIGRMFLSGPASAKAASTTEETACQRNTRRKTKGKEKQKKKAKEGRKSRFKRTCKNAFRRHYTMDL